MMISGRQAVTHTLTASASRISPSYVCSTADAISAASNKFGSVGGLSEKPNTFAPRWLNHKLAHPPLKPVWPVMRTRRPFQNPLFNRGGSLQSDHTFHGACPDSQSFSS